MNENLPTITKHEAGHGGDIHWSICTDYPIDPLDAQKLQEKAGYHPAGYGLFDFRCTKSNSGIRCTKSNSGNEIVYVSTWKCYNSCD